MNKMNKMNIPEIKIGQVWKNQRNEKFIVLDIENVLRNSDYCKLQSLQDTGEYFYGEILPSVSKEQFRNLKLVEELDYNDELRLEIHIKKLICEMRKQQAQIKTLQDQLKSMKNKAREELKELHKINPNNNSILEIGGECLTLEQGIEIVRGCNEIK